MDLTTKFDRSMREEYKINDRSTCILKVDEMLSFTTPESWTTMIIYDKNELTRFCTFVTKSGACKRIGVVPTDNIVIILYNRLSTLVVS